jgi:hypothetical protein
LLWDELVSHVKAGMLSSNKRTRASSFALNRTLRDLWDSDKTYGITVADHALSEYGNAGGRTEPGRPLSGDDVWTTVDPANHNRKELRLPLTVILAHEVGHADVLMHGIVNREVSNGVAVQTEDDGRMIEGCTNMSTDHSDPPTCH